MTDLAVAEPPTRLRALYGLPFWQVPIIINSFNRLGSLRRLTGWLLRAGYVNLHIIDNASTYPPLLSYLTSLEQSGQATVTRLAENAGPLAVWRQNLLDRLGIETEYVYTDPDVVPIEACPRDLVGVLQSVLDDNPDVAAAGVGLRVDDLPDAYGHKGQAIAWERQFWLTPAASGLFHAPIDTTLALYRPRGGHSGGSPTIRTGWPYLAAHEGWYLNHAAPSDEDLFYNRTVAPGISHWSVTHVPAWLKAAASQQARLQPSLLYISKGGGIELPGYLRVPTDGRIPLANGSVDGIYVDSPLEHLTGNQSLVTELARVARPGARMVLHPRLLTSGQLIDVLAQTSPLAHCWRLDRVTLAVTTGARAADATAVTAAIRRSPAVVRRMMAHLRAEPEATAPAPPPKIHISEIDRWAGFATVAAGESGFKKVVSGKFLM
jgi:hypothetical protein